MQTGRHLHQRLATGVAVAALAEDPAATHQPPQDETGYVLPGFKRDEQLGAGVAQMDGVWRRAFPPGLLTPGRAGLFAVEEELGPLRMVPDQRDVVPDRRGERGQGRGIVPAVAVVKVKDHRPEDRLLPFQG